MKTVFKATIGDKSFIIPARRAVIAGIWSEPDKDIITPDLTGLEALLPYRLRKAYRRGTKCIWADGAARWDGESLNCPKPYLPIYGVRYDELARIEFCPIDLDANHP